MIKVYNVGQGDSLLFKPCCCVYENDPILIDCGLSSANVYKKITEPISKVLITHTHDDHMNGLENVLKNKHITDLYIPYYLTEIQNIEKFLKNKISKRTKPLPISKLKHVRFHLLKDGDMLCGHSQVLNPPISPNIFFEDWLQQNDNVNIQIALQGLNELGFELPTDDILNYSSIFENSELQIVEEENFNFNEHRSNSIKFVHNFFISLYIRTAMANPSFIDVHTTSHLSLTANQVSIVLKYENENISYLFTGDADMSVFERIIHTHGESYLKANILKVPHHGSYENMTERLLRIINPETAIISHKNRYNHPSKILMTWFNKLNIKDYYTNDVIKKGSCLVTKTVGVCANGEVEFVS